MKELETIQRDLADVLQTLSLALDHAVVYNLPTQRLECAREQLLNVITKL